MARIIIELTNRCNLRCAHCFEERHHGDGDLPMAILDRVLKQGKGCGIDTLCFTGGEPTVHRRFGEVVQRSVEAGYCFSLVTNATNFPKILPLLLQHRTLLKGLTFSLDGAREATHDRIRGEGSYRRVLRAAALCLFNEVSFTFNMALTSVNRREVSEVVALGESLGSRGVRFGHLMFTADSFRRGLDLSPEDRREVELEIRALQDHARICVAMAPGYFSKSPFFPCAPLNLEEFNIDYRGNLTLCCQVSGLAGRNSGDVVSNLGEISLRSAVAGFERKVATYLEAKRSTVERGELGELDRFPCFYCVKYLGKAQWLERFPEHPWATPPMAAKAMARSSNA